MRTLANNLAYRYAFILCLSIALLFSQVFKAHMHLQHDAPFPDVQEHSHVVDIHLATSLHDSTLDTHHQDNQYHAEVDVSTDSFVKKVTLIDLFVLLFVFIGFTLSAPCRQRVNKLYFLKIKPISFYYLFQPPLRAPPK